MNKSHLLTNTVSYTVLLWAFFALSCSKAGINNDERYVGRLVAGDCPSYGIVEVENANIGSNWSFSGTTYTNVIGIANIPDTIQRGDRINFYVDLSTNPMDCQAVKPCQQIILVERPTDSYCATHIKRAE